MRCSDQFLVEINKIWWHYETRCQVILVNFNEESKVQLKLHHVCLLAIVKGSLCAHHLTKLFAPNMVEIGQCMVAQQN